MRDNKKKTIAIIDDDPSIFYTIKIIFSEKKYNLLYFNDARKADHKLDKESQIDLIILDMMMPKMNGLDFLKSIKDKGIKAPVIVVSLLDNANTAVEALKAGAVDYITKPFTAEKIKTKVNKILS